MINVQALTEEQRLQLLVNSISDYAVYMLDADGRIATWNPGAQRFKGYTADEAIGQHYEIFFTPRDRDAGLPNNALRIAAREGRFEADGQRVRKDGSLFWVNAVIDPIRDSNGELIGFAKITRDVTEKRETERALFESEQRFRMLVQGVNDYAIYMLDADGRVSNWNAGAERIKGYAEGEIVGQHFSKFYTETDRANGEPDRALETALVEGKYEREAWRVRKNGSLFWAHVLIDPIFDDKGEHVGFAKITRDATEQKKAQDELENAHRELVQSQKLQAIGQLTGGIAHDFNNLITVIAGSADFLKRNRSLAEAKKVQYLEGIIESADRAAALTSQLLTFGRRQQVRPEALNVSARLQGVRDLLRRTLGSTITVNLDTVDTELVVDVDPAQFEAALLNASVNARDAMPNGGTLTLSANPEIVGHEQFVRVSLADTGLGMPERVRERAFEPFFTTKEVGKGTGLGLSQIHGFAAQAGGVAEIDSEEGVGTTISLLIPLSDKVVESHEAAIGSRDTVQIDHTILLVEDNAQVRAFATDLLEDLGCTVLPVSDGAEALTKVADPSIDLVLTDIVMPGMTGIELANEITARRPGLPIILATGYSRDLSETRTEHLVILKPFTSDQLYQAIASKLA